jgi:iron complex outermembrane receptor protein
MRASGYTAVALLATVSIPSIAKAQVTSAVTDRAEEGEIIVTAQKRSQSTKDVPATVSVLGEEQLARAGVKDLFQAAVLVPGTTFSRAPDDGLQLTIRGLGSPARTQSFDQSVALFLDGTFLGKGRLYSNAFFDVERIEVIKGTQSTLLGKNTSLGAISIVTKKPGTSLEGYVSGGAELENGGEFVEGALTLPASDQLRFRFAGKYSDINGWVYNDLTGGRYPKDRDIGFRSTMVFEPHEGLDATLSYQYSDTRRIGNGYQFVDPDHLLPTSLGDGVLDGHKTSFVSQGEEGQSVHRTKSHIGNLTLNAPIGRNVLTSITSYASYKIDFVDDFDFGAKDATYFLRNEDYHQFTQELRITSPATDRFSYVAGLFYFDSNWKSAESQIYNTPLAIPPGTIFQGGFRNDFTQKTKTISAFVSTTYRFSEALRLNLGLRYTDEKKDASFGRVAIAPFTFWNQVVNPPFAAQALPFKDNFFNGNASIQYDVSPAVTLYAGYGRGTKTGGFAESAQVLTGNPSLPSDAGGSSVRSENADSFEIGAKGNAFDRAVNFELSVFLTKVSNFQDTTFTGASFDTANVNVRSVGAEGNFRARLGGGFRLEGALTYADAKITAPTERPVAGAPKWTGNIGLLFDHDISSGLAFFSSAYVRHRSSMIHQRILTFRSEPWTPVDISAGIRAPDDRWEIRLSGRNVFNAVSADFSGPPADPTLAPSIRVDAPSPLRSVRLEATIRF